MEGMDARERDRYLFDLQLEHQKADGELRAALGEDGWRELMNRRINGAHCVPLERG